MVAITGTCETCGGQVMHGGNYPLAYKQTINDLRQQLAEARAEAAALRAALEQVEYVDADPDYGWMKVRQCPWCEIKRDFRDERVHETDCPRQAALATDAGAKLLEAVRMLEGMATCDVCGGWDTHQRQVLDHSESEYEQARATLRELGVLKEQA